MAEPEEHILFSYSIDGSGSGQVLTGNAIAEEIKADHLAWVHLDATHPQTRPWLEQNMSYLDPLILDALLAEETRPRLLEFDSGVLLILRGVNLNENADPEDMISVRIWVDPHRIITLRRRRLSSVRDIEARLLKGNGPKNAGDFVAMLCARLFERMEPVLAELDDTTDDLEEKILENPDTFLRQSIIEVRKRAILMRRYMAPQKDVIGRLRTCEQPWLDTMQRRHMQESYDRTSRYVEDLDAIRERAQIVKDELANYLADHLNKNLYVLSVIAAIFLPLGFLTGLMGINIGGMPGVDDSNAFWIFSALLAVLVVGQVVLFKKLKWF